MFHERADDAEIIVSPNWGGSRHEDRHDYAQASSIASWSLLFVLIRHDRRECPDRARLPRPVIPELVRRCVEPRRCHSHGNRLSAGVLPDTTRESRRTAP